MAVSKFVLCLTSLFVLYASPADCAPQGFLNFAWPGQQDYATRLPAPSLTETVPHAAPVMSSPWSLAVPAASANRETGEAVQPRHSRPRSAVAEPRLVKVAANRPANPETIVNGEQEPIEKPVVEDATDVRQPMNTLEPAVMKEQDIQLPKVPPKVGWMKKTDEQRLMEFIPAGVAAFGAALGRDGCRLKAACLAGSLVPSSLQGRDMMLIAAETLVPAKWKEVFQAAKLSMIQKEDCNSFTCF